MTPKTPKSKLWGPQPSLAGANFMRQLEAEGVNTTWPPPRLRRDRLSTRWKPIPVVIGHYYSRWTRNGWRVKLRLVHIDVLPNRGEVFVFEQQVSKYRYTIDGNRVRAINGSVYYDGPRPVDRRVKRWVAIGDTDE